ncbi:hypothetical protein [Streptomyces sp. CB01201]|uniref:hypothetical protein n=1 Tax=Streptomyces sp. CB01201 TaxID=2020324 RepID=UPI00131BD1FE|nr:hypothetical protein [Streptomyces sp. CB01201]
MTDIRPGTDTERSAAINQAVHHAIMLGQSRIQNHAARGGDTGRTSPGSSTPDRPSSAPRIYRTRSQAVSAGRCGRRHGNRRLHGHGPTGLGWEVRQKRCTCLCDHAHGHVGCNVTFQEPSTGKLVYYSNGKWGRMLDDARRRETTTEMNHAAFSLGS